MILNFVKEKKKWYIDLPEWTGRKSSLQMVDGADTLLDYISEGKANVKLLVSTEMFENANCLGFLNKTWFNGANYKIDTYNNYFMNLKVWLCDVTKFVMNEFPEKIYFAKMK